MANTEKLYRFLERHRISFRRWDHPPVNTVEDVHRLIPDLPGAKTKNLFLYDDKGRRYFLVTVPDGKTVDLKSLSAALDAKKLRFASPGRLARRLGLEPGAVTLLGVVNDEERRVQVVIDTAVWHAEAVQCHPLVNTSTLVLAVDDLRGFLEATDHTPQVLTVPERA
ncbi:MAG: prolyl-tRNA synthetase associated domain-containing protein [Desulfobacterales bacterium]